MNFGPKSQLENRRLAEIHGGDHGDAGGVDASSATGAKGRPPGRPSSANGPCTGPGKAEPTCAAKYIKLLVKSVHAATRCLPSSSMSPLRTASSPNTNSPSCWRLVACTSLWASNFISNSCNDIATATSVFSGAAVEAAAALPLMLPPPLQRQSDRPRSSNRFSMNPRSLFTVTTKVSCRLSNLSSAASTASMAAAAFSMACLAIEPLSPAPAAAVAASVAADTATSRASSLSANRSRSCWTSRPRAAACPDASVAAWSCSH
mmetsp:Transcript_43016/g.125080  ORF Transcript_43016/g.125080 Transcript_43016/m.125080 type:complete len:262 (-) Transcript_43016:831-1616(-)